MMLSHMDPAARNAGLPDVIFVLSVRGLERKTLLVPDLGYGEAPPAISQAPAEFLATGQRYRCIRWLAAGESRPYGGIEDIFKVFATWGPHVS